MNEGPADKLWKDLPPEKVEYFFKQCATRSELLSDLAYKTSCELAKYLFAANTGAAAGVFLLVRASPRGFFPLLSFFAFIAGTFFVGVSYLALASWSREVSDGWTQDLNAWGRSEITIGVMDANNRARRASWKGAVAHIGLRVSFGFLIAGAVTAGISLWK